MNRGVYWWVCLVTLVVSVCGSLVGAIRWLGSDHVVRSLAWLGHAPLFLGSVGATLVYALVQSLPGGREPLWIMSPPNDGWVIVLGQAALCGALAAFPTMPSGQLEVLLSGPLTIVTTFFFIDRIRRVQRQLVSSGFVRPS